MYLNDVNIVIYVIIVVLGAWLGTLVKWCNERLPERKKIFCKEFITNMPKLIKTSWLYSTIIAVMYILLVYRLGIGDTIITNIKLIKYLILVPMLISAFVIDMKLTIIPNRLNLTMFEIGLIICFIEGIINFNIAIVDLLGMLVGAGIFLAISFVGRLIAGKEAMGMGDVKLMGALGLYFGLFNTIAVTVLSFLIGAVISIAVIVLKKSENGYIPFGPFIVIAAFVAMLVPENILVGTLLEIFTLGMF